LQFLFNFEFGGKYYARWRSVVVPGYDVGMHNVASIKQLGAGVSGCP
jgi:hypothetical protein